MSDTRDIGKEGERREDFSEGRASSSTQTAVATGTTKPDVLTEKQPRKELEMEPAPPPRRPVFSGSLDKVGEKMGFFLFDVLVTPGDVQLDRLLIPVEAALKYFPPLDNRQKTYKEKIEISDPEKTDWHMTLRYDSLECFFVVESKWRVFVIRNNVDIMDVIRFYKPIPLVYDTHYLVQIVKRRYPRMIYEFKTENFLFQLPLTDMDIMFKRLYITMEDVRNHFPVVGIPAETHNTERLYFTDDLSNIWFIKVQCHFNRFHLMLEGFLNDYNLKQGDIIRFYKPDPHWPLHPRHFLIQFVRKGGDPTQAGTAAINYSMDTGSDRQGDGRGGTDGGGNREDGGGGSRSVACKWWKFGFEGCCMARRSNARTEEL